MQEQPKTLVKLEKKAKKLTKLLIEKYRLADDANGQGVWNRGGEDGEPQVDLGELRQAEERAERMNNKLKLIRTLLGYECHKKNRQQGSMREQQGKHQQKASTLKNYVLTMRRRSDFPSAIHQKEAPQIIGVNLQNALTEYSDINIKFIHSFLPHQSTLQHNLIKEPSDNHHHPKSNVGSYELKSSSAQVRSFKTITPVKHSQSQIAKFPQQNNMEGGQIVLKSTIAPMLEQSILLHKSSNKKSQMSQKQSQRFSTLNLISMQAIDPREALKPNGCSQIYTNRPSYLLYHGKNYKKDLFRSICNNRELSRRREAVGEVCISEKRLINGNNFHLPQIKVCAPEFISKTRPSIHH